MTPMKQISNVGRMAGSSSSELDWRMRSGRENPGCCNSLDVNQHHKESYVNKEDCAEEIEECQPPPKRSGRLRKMPVRFLDTVMVKPEDPKTYERETWGAAGAVNESWPWRKRWIERYKTCTKTVLPSGKDAILWNVVLKRRLDEPKRSAPYKAHLMAKGYF